MITEKFYDEFSEKVKDFENERLKIYDDGHGIPTIGIGFALIIRNGNKWVAYPQNELKELGINLSAKQYKIIQDYAAAKSRQGKPSDELRSELKNMDFCIDDTISKKLLRYSINDKYGFIERTIGEDTWNKLGLARQIGVMDHCFHHGNISSIADHLKSAVESGKFDQVADIMRKDSKIEAFKARAELLADYVLHNKLTFDGIHVVQPGQTLASIAKSNNLKLEDLKKLNPQLGENINKLSVGQKINIGNYVNNDSSKVIEIKLPSAKPKLIDASVFNQLVRECNAILKKCFEKANNAFKSFVQKQHEVLEKNGEVDVANAKGELDTAYGNYVRKHDAKFSELTGTVTAESQAKFAEVKAQVAAANAANKNLAFPKAGGTITVDNKDIVAKYQSIYSQFNAQYKSEYDNEVANINTKYQELARQTGEKTAKLIATEKENLSTAANSFAQGIRRILDEIKRKVKAGEAVDIALEKQQVLQNAKQFLDGVYKNLGIVDNVDIAELMGLEGASVKEAA